VVVLLLLLAVVAVVEVAIVLVVRIQESEESTGSRAQAEAVSAMSADWTSPLSAASCEYVGVKVWACEAINTGAKTKLKVMWCTKNCCIQSVNAPTIVILRSVLADRGTWVACRRARRSTAKSNRGKGSVHASSISLTWVMVDDKLYDFARLRERREEE
jgi:hypothetical protein